MTIGDSRHHLSEHEQTSRQAINTFRVGLGTGILFLIVTVFSALSTIQSGLYAFGGIVLTAVITIISFTAAYLARHGKASLGANILVSSILLLSFFLPVLAKGQGISLAILNVVVVSGIARYTLTGKWPGRVTITSLVVGVVIILADLFLPDFGIPSDPRITNITSMVVGTIYVIIIFWRFGTYSLRTKLIIAFIIITLVPITGLSLYSNATMRAALSQQAESDLNRLVVETAARMDTYISSRLDALRVEAQQPSLAIFLQSTPADQEENKALALQALLSFSLDDPVFTVSYSLLNLEGRNVLSTAPSQIGFSEKEFEYFTMPVTTGTPHVSSLLFINSTYPTVYFSAPVRAENGATIGVLKAEYYATIFQSIVQSVGGKQQDAPQILIIDRSTLLRVAGTSEPEKMYLSYKEFTSKQLLELKIQYKLPPGIYEKVTFPSPEFESGIENIGNQNMFEIAPTKNTDTGSIVAGKIMVTQPWVILAQQATDKIYAQADIQTRANIFWALGSSLFAVLAAFGATTIISRPIVSLAKVAEQIAEGDFSARATVTVDDEVGQLSQVFNEMTEQLSQTLSGLEQRVEERTLELQSVSQQSVRRAQQLQSITDISKLITREQNIGKLLPLITDIISERFGYYHTGVFLLDETRRTALLEASNSPGGQRMVVNGHRLTLGTGSIVGYAALTGKPRIALDVGEDAVFFNNPNLPETRSEMALPLAVRNVVIGVIDIQSKQSGAFTQEDIDILSVLADQVAIAVENARLFQQTQSALKESQEIVQSFLRQEWLALASKQTMVGYLHAGLEGKPLAEPAQYDELEHVLRRGAVIKKENKVDEDLEAILALPIALGEQVIGAIRVQARNRDHTWSTEEINLLRSISERVGLALDNARLVASSQKHAAKERVIGEISAKISAAPDVETILQTAVQEIGHTLSDADVVIQIKEFEEE